MEQAPLEKQKRLVHQAALASQFEDSDQGKLIIGWLNAEVYSLTSRLADDDELDTDNVARANVRGQLKAYRLIGQKLGIAKTRGVQAAEAIRDSGEDPSAVDPEELAKRAGI